MERKNGNSMSDIDDIKKEFEEKKNKKPPDIIIDATKEYRRDEDLLGHFIQECCYEEKYTKTPATDLYEAFKKLWEVNVSRKVPSQKRFESMIVKKNQTLKIRHLQILWNLDFIMKIKTLSIVPLFFCNIFSNLY
jgi:hypothetical protein